VITSALPRHTATSYFVRGIQRDLCTTRGIQIISSDTPLDSPSFRKRGELVWMPPPGSKILFVEIWVLTDEGAEPRKNELRSKVSEGNAGFVFRGKNIRDIVLAGNMKH
jgi:hypothetical protein